MNSARLYISHNSALHFWRTNPPRYVLEGGEQNIRALYDCPATGEEIRTFKLSEAEFGNRPIDVLVPPSSPRPRSILNYHIQKASLPPRSLYPIRDGIYVVSPDLCFVQLCKSLSFPEALELGMELCGTYALRPDELGDKASRNYQLTRTVALRRKTNIWKDIHGLTSARKVAPLLADGSASPMETKLYLLLCLPQIYGGYNIEKPELNARIELPLESRLVLRQEAVIPDLLWRRHKLVVEYDGEYHNDPAQARKDAMRKATLEALGYTVLTVKKQLLYNPSAFASIATVIAKHTGRRIRPLTLKQQFARDSLRQELLAA